MDPVGTIGLPFSGHDVSAIAATLALPTSTYDGCTAVIEIPADKLLVRNATFTGAVTALADRAMRELKIAQNAPAAVTLRSLTIRREGAGDALPDTSKSGAARLAVHLPAKVIGGLISTSFGSELVHHENSVPTELTSSWTVCLPGARLGTDTVIEGHLCTLNYDLSTVLDQQVLTGASMDQIRHDLPGLLRELSVDPDGHSNSQNVQWLAYSLGKYLSKTVPSAETLPQKLKRQVDLLSDVCAVGDTELLLAVMKRRVKGHQQIDGEDEQSFDDEREEQLYLADVRTLTGVIVAPKMALYHRHLLCREVLHERADHETSEEEDVDPTPFNKPMYFDDADDYPDEDTDCEVDMWGRSLRHYDRHYTKRWRRLVSSIG